MNQNNLYILYIVLLYCHSFINHVDCSSFSYDQHYATKQISVTTENTQRNELNINTNIIKNTFDEEDIDIINAIYCECYNIEIKDIFNNNDEICYIYSVIPNNYNWIEICNFDINDIVLGICDNDINEYDLSINSITSTNNNDDIIRSHSHKTHSSSIVGIKIEDFMVSYNMYKEFILCMDDINDIGITSNNIQFEMNNKIVQCNANNNGLPCQSSQCMFLYLCIKQSKLK